MEKKTVVRETHSSSHTLLTVLVILSLLLNALSLYLLLGYSFPSSSGTDGMGIKKALLEMEYDKVGGKENYDIMNKAQMTSLHDPQNPSNLNAMKQYIASKSGATADTTVTTTPPAPTPTAPTGTLAPADVQALLSSSVIEGNKSADIVAIEYSDMECPFCVRQYNDTKLQESLTKTYGDKVAFVFKNNRGVNHSGTEAKALGALCAKKVGGEKGYLGFYKGVMNGNKGLSAAEMYPVADLPKLAKSLGLDMTKWQACVDNKETLAQFSAETAEAQKYGLSGTPGTLILNVKTGKYATVEGAYPFTEFQSKIDSLK